MDMQDKDDILKEFHQFQRNRMTLFRAVYIVSHLEDYIDDHWDLCEKAIKKLIRFERLSHESLPFAKEELNWIIDEIKKKKG